MAEAPLCAVCVAKAFTCRMARLSWYILLMVSAKWTAVNSGSVVWPGSRAAL